MPGVSGKSGVRPTALNPAVWCDGAKADRRPLDLRVGSGNDLSGGNVACRGGGRRSGLWSEGEEAHINGGFRFSCEWGVETRAAAGVLGVLVCLRWRS